MFCKHCIYGKKCRKKFKAGSHVSKDVLEYVHSNVWGPSPTVSYEGAKYYVLFVDEFSRKVWVYVIKRKDDVFNIFKHFRVMVKKELVGQSSF